MTSDEFKDAQAKLGLRNQAMAEQIGVSRSTVDKYRSGAVPVPPPVRKLVTLLVERQRCGQCARGRS